MTTEKQMAVRLAHLQADFEELRAAAESGTHFPFRKFQLDNLKLNLRELLQLAESLDAKLAIKWQKTTKNRTVWKSWARRSM